MTSARPDCRPNGRYSVKQTCQLLGISRMTLYRWTYLMKIPVRYRGVGNHPYYRGEDIINLFDKDYEL